LLSLENLDVKLFCIYNTAFRDQVLEFKTWALIGPFLNHLRWAWCDSDAQYKNLNCRFAQMFQYPWLKDGVTTNVAGNEGCGKSIIFRILGMLIGENHFVTVQNMEDITGNFTGILENKLLVFVDEAFTNNIKEMNILKNMITAEKIRIRKMYQDIEYTESMAKFGTSTNFPDSSLMVGKNARRFEMTWVEIEPLLDHPQYKSLFNGDKELYFKFLMDSLTSNNNEGLKTLLNYFYNYPLPQTWKDKVIPTKILFDTKIKYLTPVEQFWLHCLTNSVNKQIYTSPDDDNNGKRQPNFIATPVWANCPLVSEIFQYFLSWAKRSKLEHDINSTEIFWTKLNQLLPTDIELFDGSKTSPASVSFGEASAIKTKLLPAYDKLLPGLMDYLENRKDNYYDIKKKRIDLVANEKILSNFHFMPEKIIPKPSSEISYADLESADPEFNPSINLLKQLLELNSM
jgi:hypothetical protein